jgi:hypothetical protein
VTEVGRERSLRRILSSLPLKGALVLSSLSVGTAAGEDKHTHRSSQPDWREGRTGSEGERETER